MGCRRTATAHEHGIRVLPAWPGPQLHQGRERRTQRQPAGQHPRRPFRRGLHPRRQPHQRSRPPTARRSHQPGPQRPTHTGKRRHERNHFGQGVKSTVPHSSGRSERATVLIPRPTQRKRHGPTLRPTHSVILNEVKDLAWSSTRNPPPSEGNYNPVDKQP